MLQSGNIPHALLFAGSKGTGKTSSARIIAKVLNCEKNKARKAGDAFVEPCNECEMCTEITNGNSLNVVEMDGASNRRIDDIRQLKERLYMPPARGAKSVYIIDEVHMLTKEAFNALLKMLEEPPEHVVFIFATTDPQKIPDTILSRTTRIQFTKATDQEIASALENIAKQEKITIAPESVVTLAQAADGSFRDAVKIFEQLVNQAEAEKAKITAEWVAGKLSSVSTDKIQSLLQSILQKDEIAIIEFFQMVRDQQIDVGFIHKQILQFLHQELIKGFDPVAKDVFAKKEITLFLLKQFSSVEIPMLHPFPWLPLELCAIEMVLKSKEKSGAGGQTKKTVTVQPSIKVPNPPAPSIPVVQTVKTEEATVIESILPEPVDDGPPLSSVDGNMLGEKWQDLLRTVGKKNLSLEAILRSAQFVRGEEGRAEIKVFYGFHKEQLELDRYRVLIEQAIQELLGGAIRLEYQLSEQAKDQVQNPNSNVSGKQDAELVGAIEEALL
jgi:DNA polymerase-3 subunit gamma/tau